MFQTELAGANTISPVISPYQTQQFLSSFIATEEQVLQLMRGVDTSKVYGYDGVGNRIIKMCSDGFMSISFVLSICLFHLVISLVSGSFANVIPTFKNDNRQLKVNCRPVSLLASFSKICEKIFFFYLYNFLMEICISSHF